MSDLDKVLERLVVDPGFKAALAADPDRALAGYRLGAEERELLGAPVASGSGPSHAVEERTSKSGVVGLIGPTVAAFGVAAGGQTFGSAQGSSTFGAAGGQTMGAASDGGEPSFGNAPRLDGTVTFDEDPGPTQTFGDTGAIQAIGSVSDQGPAEAADYRTWVDVDGDGTWDAHTAYERSDGGVDIYADMDGDGRADFIGHDLDRDGLVDSADYDTDLDGVMDTRMYDDTGDGWLDRSEAFPVGDQESTSQQTFGPAPG